MKLEPIQDYIAGSTDLTMGRDLFVYSMPASAKSAVLIVTENAGNQVDHEVKGVFKGRYQIIVRDSDMGRCTTRAYELFDLLDLTETDVGEYVITYSRPRHTPNPIGGRSEGDLIEMSINFDLRYRTP